MQPESKIIKYRDTGIEVGIHTLRLIQNRTHPTLVFLPGLPGAAEEGMRCLRPCYSQGFNVVSMSFRGRGRSSTPRSGYKVENHASDLAAVLEDIDCSQVILVANSTSTLYATDYLTRGDKTPVRACVIVDHPLQGRKLETGWADMFAEKRIQGHSVLDTCRLMALDRIEHESEEISYYEDYEALNLPTLLLAAHPRRSLLTENDMEQYQRQKRTRIVRFEKSGHIIRHDEPGRFVAEIVGFARSLELRILE